MSITIIPRFKIFSSIISSESEEFPLVVSHCFFLAPSLPQISTSQNFTTRTYSRSSQTWRCVTTWFFIRNQVRTIVSNRSDLKLFSQSKKVLPFSLFECFPPLHCFVILVDGKKESVVDLACFWSHCLLCFFSFLCVEKNDCDLRAT